MLNELLEVHVLDVSVCRVSEPPIVPVYLWEIFSVYIPVGEETSPSLSLNRNPRGESGVHCHIYVGLARA
jgi:hypothetical protein